MRHEIVHNGHEVESLKTKGARFVESMAELPVFDATCRSVAKVHIQGEHYVRRGRSAVLIGYAGHPEVEATIDRVQTEEYVPARELAADIPLTYVTQTTLSIDDTRSPSELLDA